MSIQILKLIRNNQFLRVWRWRVGWVDFILRRVKLMVKSMIDVYLRVGLCRWVGVKVGILVLLIHRMIWWERDIL